MKKILVTGANGQLGTTLKKLSPTSSHHWIFTTRKELDIANSNSVNLFFTENEFDICINCAAYTKVEDAEKEAKQAGEINVEAVQKLVLACNEKQCTLINRLCFRRYKRNTLHRSRSYCSAESIRNKQTARRITNSTKLQFVLHSTDILAL